MKEKIFSFLTNALERRLEWQKRFGTLPFVWHKRQLIGIASFSVKHAWKKTLLFQQREKDETIMINYFKNLSLLINKLNIRRIRYV